MVEGEEMVLKKTIFTNIIKTLPKSNKKGGKLSPLTATFLRASGGKMSVRVGSKGMALDVSECVPLVFGWERPDFTLIGRSLNTVIPICCESIPLSFNNNVETQRRFTQLFHREVVAILGR